MSDAIDHASGRAIIAIPCAPQDFGKFIAGLLKTPRRTERSVSQVMDIGLNDILDVVAIIDQRIRDQHRASQVNFQAQIYYDDGRSFNLPSVEQLQSFAEVGRRRCVGITVSLVYLIEMPSSEVPSRQEVDFSLRVPHFRLSERMMLNADLLPLYGRAHGSASYVIRHTSVSFGYDIANLLDEKFRELCIKDKFAELFAAWWMRPVVLGLSSGVGLSIAILMNIWVLAGLARGAVSVSPENSLAFAMIAEAVSSFVLIAGVVLTMVFGSLLLEFLARPRPSFISLTPAARKEADESLHALRTRWYVLVGSIVGSLVVGTLASLAASAIWTVMVE